jgi:hypothetical protein
LISNVPVVESDPQVTVAMAVPPLVLVPIIHVHVTLPVA